MKKVNFLNLSLSGMALALAIGLASCQQKSNKANNARPDTATQAADKDESGVRIAYVNIDTLEAKYTYYKEAKDAFDKKQAAVEAQLRASAEKLQSEYLGLKKKAQAGTLSQAEGEAAEKRLAEMQQDLEAKRQSLTADLLKDQQAFTDKLQGQLDSFIAEYNKDKHYDYILSYAKGGSILLANPKLDITEDVLKSMNDAAKNKNQVKP
ncbi:MAG TPA: OmpH family outer membrane protein [Edaphocola sp.]|nr:OmpH family outer membrane protein [Edaphocola sp.]